MGEQIQSPCMAICQLDDEEQFCIGCLRTPVEIEQWESLNDDEKKLILKEIEKRRDFQI